MAEHDYSSIFGSIGRAKPISNFTSRLGIGTHTVALKRFAVKISQKDNKGTPILEADFTVLQSNSHSAGETRGWAWFIGSQGWAGAYEEARAKEFLAAVAKCIGDTRDTSAIGSDLANPAQPGRGLVLTVEISPQTNRDGTAKKNAKGEAYTNAVWSAVAQDGVSVAQVRAQLDAMDAAGPQPAAQAPAPQQQAQPSGFGFGQPAPAAAPSAPPASGFSNMLAGLKR